MWDAVWSLLQPQPWHPSIIWVHPYPNFSKFCPHTLHKNYSVRVNPYAHSHHIKVLNLKHFVYIQQGCEMQSLWLFSASTMTAQCHSGSAITQIFKNWPLASYLHMYYSVRVNPYAHPQHIKVLKHIECILYGCGLQSEASCSINHDTTSSFGFAHTPIFQNLAPSGSI